MISSEEETNSSASKEETDADESLPTDTSTQRSGEDETSARWQRQRRLESTDERMLSQVTARTSLSPRRPDTIATTERSVMAKTPTTDHTVQTSRRPTWDCVFECKYGYHFPSSPTPSMISDLAKQVQRNLSKTQPQTSTTPKTISIGRSKITLVNEAEEQVRRLRDMFPTATVPVIEQMVRIYHGREGLIKAALISLGYKRSSELEAKQATAQSPIMLMMSKPSSKKLFDKLVGYFPDKDETLIKELMFRHKEVEHEIISSLVESSTRANEFATESCLARRIDKLTALAADKNGSIMKLRYLKFLYPSCEEIELYHLLHCNDLNVQRVVEIIEERGHTRANVDEALKNRQSQTQQMKAAQVAHAAKDKEPFKDIVEAHRNRTKPTVAKDRVSNLRDNLKKSFPDQSEEFLLRALEATDFNEGLAKKFIDEMAPVDESVYKQRYEFHRDEEPSLVAFPCKAIQKGGTSFMSIMCNENVYIPKEIVECKTALALLKQDACTCTDDDFEVSRLSLRTGPNLSLAAGSMFKREPNLRASRKPLRSVRGNKMQVGSKYESIVADENRPKPNARARSRNKSLVRGPNSSLKVGHNATLLERVHPFFKDKTSTTTLPLRQKGAERVETQTVCKGSEQSNLSIVKVVECE